MTGPVAPAPNEASAGTAALVADETAIIGQTSAVTETTGDVGIADIGARLSTATAAAIDASATAIDEIVAAAAAAMAQEAARVQAPASAPVFVEISAVKTAPVVSASEPPAARAQLLIAAVDVVSPAPRVAATARKPVPTTATEPAIPVVDNALSAIMALSEEERLALFT